MPEDEEGFTFVDKRRLPTESAPADATPAETQATNPPGPLSESDDDADAGEGVPDIYSLIGYCLSLLQADAWQKMGLLADPQTGVAAVDLHQAKVAIDAVGDLAARLEAAPPEAVPESLKRDLRALMNDLRLNYVAQQKQPA